MRLQILKNLQDFTKFIQTITNTGHDSHISIRTLYYSWPPDPGSDTKVFAVPTTPQGGGVWDKTLFEYSTVSTVRLVIHSLWGKLLSAKGLTEILEKTDIHIHIKYAEKKLLMLWMSKNLIYTTKSTMRKIMSKSSLTYLFHSPLTETTYAYNHNLISSQIFCSVFKK